MSFILDALKKSENERQRRSGPSLATVRTGSSRATGFPWFGLIAALLALNLIVVLGFLVWPDDDAVPLSQQTGVSGRSARPATPDPAPAAVREAETREVDTLSARATTPVPGLKPVRPSVRSLAEESARGETTPARPTSATPVRAAVERAPDPQQEPAISEPPVVQALPTMNELTLDGRLNLPTLHVDIHVYSLKREGRFVFINNRKYKEGEQLSEGPSVEEISEEGVILNHRGQRFLLPRD